MDVMIHPLTSAKVHFLWGGTRLSSDFAKGLPGESVAESWELSCHPRALSRLPDGRTLKAYLEAHPRAAGDLAQGLPEFPVLVKLIDAADDLSVQVHPDEAYARKHEGQPGKTEMWYIIDALPGSRIYLGLRETMTREACRRAIEDNTILGCLNAVPARPGDVFFIPPGTIHSIGAGCLLAEVQTSSDVTYRMYDFDRRDADGHKRELHVEKALDVARLSPPEPAPPFGPHLVSCPLFTADLLRADGALEVTADDRSFRHFLVLDGSATFTADGETFRASRGGSFFADAGTGLIKIKGRADVLMTGLN